MKKRQSPKATGILGGTLKPRPLGAWERNILDEASSINTMHSQRGMVRAAIAEISDYVWESRHPIPKKIANLKADLAKQANPEIRDALKKAIAKLKNF